MRFEGSAHEASGIWGHLDFFAQLVRVVDEMLQNARELRRCASNRIQVHGLLPKCSNGPSRRVWPFAANARSPGLAICPVPPADTEGQQLMRSEERRVGKECRHKSSPY